MLLCSDMRITFGRGGVDWEEMGEVSSYPLFLRDAVARNKGQGSSTSTSWPFGQQGRDRV